MNERFICNADDCASGNVFHKNSTIIELPDGDLLSAWMAGGVGEGNRDQNVYGARLSAGDDEWGDSELLVGVENRAVGCPILFIGPDDDLWLTAPEMYGNWIQGSRLMFKRSPDYGETWYDLEILHEKPGLYLKNKPLYLEEEGRWLLGSSTYGSEDIPHFLLIQEDYSDRPADFPMLAGGDQIAPNDPEGFMGSQPLIYPTATELDDGTLLALMRPNPPEDENGHLWRTVSTDRGINWTEAEETEIPNPNAGFDLHRTQAGNHLLIVNPTKGQYPPDGRNKLALMLSEDDCETWPYQIWLEREETDQELRDMPDGERPEFTYGNIIQGQDGTIHLAYEHRRRRIKHIETSEEEIRTQGDGSIAPGIN